MTDIDDLDDCPEPWGSEIERLREENERLLAAICLAVVFAALRERLGNTLRTFGDAANTGNVSLALPPRAV